MSAVVDSSVLVAATVDAGAEGIWAERILENGRLAAPHLILVEATNILRRLELAKRLSSLAAASARQDLLRLDIDLFSFEPFADRVWELRANLTCYDAWPWVGHGVRGYSAHASALLRRARQVAFR